MIIMVIYMTLKKWKVISCIGIFLLSALLHFIYDWFPSFFTSLFFPVNESIWEHNKIIIGSFLIWGILEKIYYKKEKMSFLQNVFLLFICSFSSYDYFYANLSLCFKNTG